MFWGIYKTLTWLFRLSHAVLHMVVLPVLVYNCVYYTLVFLVYLILELSICQPPFSYQLLLCKLWREFDFAAGTSLWKSFCPLGSCGSHTFFTVWWCEVVFTAWITCGVGSVNWMIECTDLFCSGVCSHAGVRPSDLRFNFSSFSQVWFLPGFMCHLVTPGLYEF